MKLERSLDNSVHTHSPELAVRSPVFLVGPLRSGTTLLRLMLDSHSLICNFGEFEYAVKYARGNDFPTYGEYCNLLSTDRVFLRHAFDIEVGHDAQSLARSFLVQAAKRSGKPIIGATIHSRFDLARVIWPSARFIHLIRDPRDVARSCIGMGWVGNVWYGADYWIDVERRWEAMKAQLNEGEYIELRYEALVASPDKELSRICDFLQVPYSHCMLEYHKSTSYSAPNAAFANQWHHNMREKEVALVESKCGPLMQQLGYKRTSELPPPSFSRRCRLSVHNSIVRRAFNVRRYGMRLYLEWQISKRLPPAFSRWQQRILMAKNAIDEAHLK